MNYPAKMADGGVKKAAWSTESEEFHALYAEIAITHTPLKKPHVVCAQIHNNKDDVLAIRLEGKHLFSQERGTSLSLTTEIRFLTGKSQNQPATIK